MRLSIADTPSPAASAPPAPAADPAAPDLAVLTRDPAAALRSFFATVDRIAAANPVAIGRLHELAGKARGSPLSEAESNELQQLKLQALRQGRAVGAVIGFFLKLRPYPMLEEIRARGKLFQPAFGPVLVVDGETVRGVLERDQEFTVEPYGAEMMKVMSPAHNGRFTTFVLSTDDSAVYEPDKRLLSLVCNRQDADRLTGLVHRDCMRRVGAAVRTARANGSSAIDVVQSVARYVPVTLGHEYLGVPVAERPGSFALTDEMLTYYGQPIEGQLETALGRQDGVIPDETLMYAWIKAAFQHFFNNVQKDREVQKQGFRACRLLLAYLLREIALHRQRILNGEPVADTMLTRMLHFQLGRSTPSIERPPDLDPRLVSDLRIAENVMGTIVGAVAGQEEATGRVIDSLMRLRDGECRTDGPAQVPVRQLCRGETAGVERSERPGHGRKPRGAGQVLPRSPAAPAPGRGAAAQVRARRRPHRRQPADRGGHARLRLARVGDEGRSRAGRVHPGSAPRTLPAVRVGPPHVSRAARLSGHHRRDDDCAAGTAGPGAARARCGGTVGSVRAAPRPAAARRSEPVRHFVRPPVFRFWHHAAVLAAGGRRRRGDVTCRWFARGLPAVPD